MFTKPVDTEEVPDYNLIIKQPMDLETMMTKIDMNCYLCAREFLDDIDLICRNALEYNPDRLVNRIVPRAYVRVEENSHTSFVRVNISGSGYRYRTL